MSLARSNKIVSSKIGILADHRNNLAKQADLLQIAVGEINEVLQLATSWLGNADGTNNFTFTDINKMIEDKLVFLSITDFSVDNEHQESTTACLLPTSASTDQLLPSSATSIDQPFPARTVQVSVVPEEVKAIMNQVKVMQDAMSFLSLSSEKFLEKQLTMEKCVESLVDKCSTIEHQKISEIEMELKSISDKQKKISSHQDKLRKDFEMKIQSFGKKEILELKKQSQKFMQDLNDALEDIHKLNTQISVLEDQTGINKQLEALTKNVQLLEASSDNLAGKFTEHGLAFEEFRTRMDETVTNLSSGHEMEFEKLQKFEEKIATLETRSETSQETKTSYQDVETKYEMVCQVLADRLLPLEKLRDIFNEKLDVRTENIRKMNTVCDQMAVLQPKLSQLETHAQGEAIGFSARIFFSIQPNENTFIKDLSEVFTDFGIHFNPNTGVFTAPLDGLYAASLSVAFTGNGCPYISLKKIPCTCIDLCKKCHFCKIDRRTNADAHASSFIMIYLKTSERLYVQCKDSYNNAHIVSQIDFSCFKVN